MDNSILTTHLCYVLYYDYVGRNNTFTLFVIVKLLYQVRRQKNLSMLCDFVIS